MKNVHQLPRPDQLESVATPGHFFTLLIHLNFFVDLDMLKLEILKDSTSSFLPQV